MDETIEQAVMLTSEMLQTLQARVARVCSGGGWGVVSVVIEKGQPVRVQTMDEEWLNRRR